MLQDVLPVARAPMHPAHELDELRMQAVDAGLVSRLLANLDDLCIHLFARLVDDFFNSAGMDAAVRHELLEREPRDLASNRIEARHDDGVGRVVDDDVDTGGQLERANVAPLAADDPTLHLVVWKGYRRNSALRRVLRK